MKTRIRIESQVEDFVKALAPVPRRRLRSAIKGLAGGRGNIKPLEGKLAGYSRLSVTGYRVIIHERFESGTRIIDCLFAERRAVVYEIFLHWLAEQTVHPD